MESSRPCVLFVDDEANILRSIRREFFDAPFNPGMITSLISRSGLSP